MNTKNNYKISVLGCGYVGLPLILELKNYYNIVAFDINEKRINQLNNGVDINNEFTKKFLNRNKVFYTCEDKYLANSDIFIVTVPTPIFKNNKPDLRLLIKANKFISKYLDKKNIIIYESTFYPGVTKEICYKFFLDKLGFKINLDYFCAYSPERINPGDTKHTIKNVTKLVAGSNMKTANKVKNIYRKFVKKIKVVSSIEVAEAAKIIENSQRDINIAFMNEISIIFNKLSLNTKEILEAAKTKWNFLDFQPGFVGGHCIGVDPYYLSYISERNGYKPQVILSGRKVNDNMNKFVYSKIKSKFKSKKNNILILGAAFKENCNDIRNSQTLILYKNLIKNFQQVYIYDPLVNFDKKYFFNNPNKIPKLNNYDAIILAVPHNEIISKGKSFINKFGKKNYKFYDIKSVFKKSYFAL